MANKKDIYIDYVNARYLIENKWFPFGSISTFCLNYINSLSDFEKYSSFMENNYNSPFKMVSKETGNPFTDQELKEKFEIEHLVYNYIKPLLDNFLIPENETLWFWFLNRTILENNYSKVLSDQEKEWKETEWKEIETTFSTRNDFEKYLSSCVSFVGTENFMIDDKKMNLVHVKVSDIQNLYSSDFIELLYNPKVSKPINCISCGFLFVPNSTKDKYCSCCRDNIHKINYEKVKNNPAKRLHKNILNYYNVVCHEKGTSETVTKFRNESSYYSDIVQGKKPKVRKLKSYQNIKTESEYISWLENFYSELKETHKKG